MELFKLHGLLASIVVVVVRRRSTSIFRIIGTTVISKTRSVDLQLIHKRGHSRNFTAH